MSPNFGWIITNDLVNDCEDVGRRGPRCISEDIESRLKAGEGRRFKMYDDDGELYYEGLYIGSADHEDAPFLSFGMPNAGCTSITWPFKARAVSLNETQHYNIREKDKPFIRGIHEVYFYDVDKTVHCCELTPSRELHYLYTYIETSDDCPDDKRDELDGYYCHESHDEVVYMWVSRVDKLTNQKDCGEFESEEEAREFLQSNWPI